MSNLEQQIINYWNKNPCNINHGKSNINSIDFFNEVNIKRQTAQPHIAKFANYSQYNGKRVLEIGCGIGTDAEQFAKCNADYTGIDISDRSIDICQKRFRLLNLPGKFFVRNAADDLNDLGKFDMVYCWGVLHHFPDPGKILKNINKVLNISGELKVMVYAKNSWKYAMICNGLDQFEAANNCPYADVYTKTQITNLLEKNQFTVRNISQDHCFMFDVPEYKNSNYVLLPWFEAMPEKVRRAVNKSLGWHLMINAEVK